MWLFRRSTHSLRQLLLCLGLLLQIGVAQKYGNDLPIVVPTGPDATFPDLITADNFPLFPFTDQFNTGIELNPANKVALTGDLNIPIPNWGNMDLDGNLYAGHINVDSKVGYQIRPTNHLNIKPETLALVHQNPAFRKARKEAKEVTLGRLPYGYEPIRCKPPYCNPFVHHAAVAVEVEQGDDSFFLGGIDFPLPLGTNGAGVRFPLSGAVEQGTSPYAYAHGSAYNPASPFNFETIDNLKKTKKAKTVAKTIRRAPLPKRVAESEEESSDEID
uniref:DM13 domain-containing protein n=1 Tax=Panagrellus redivivus TaxID=6233 RepID=A0A7E4ZQE8_PANRE